MTFGQSCPVSDLFGHAGRELLERLAIPDPWRRNVDASLELIDDLELQIASLTVELRRQGAGHRYVPLLVSAPGFGWINAYTVASEIGDIARFSSPAKLVGYTGLRPRVYQSGASDRRGPISKQGSRYLRWALFEAALHACTHPVDAERYQRTKKRLGRQRGPKVAQIDLSRKLTGADLGLRCLPASVRDHWSGEERLAFLGGAVSHRRHLGTREWTRAFERVQIAPRALEFRSERRIAGKRPFQASIASPPCSPIPCLSPWRGGRE